MTELLSRLFIRGSRDPKDPAVREKYGTMSSIVGIAVNLLLSAIKLIAGILSASVAITADALNNLSDAGSSLVTLVSFRISAKPADKDHPFGHARIEYIASMIVSFLILLVGVELFADSFKKLVGIEEAVSPDFSILVFIILSVSILAKLWLAIFYKKIGKKIDSSVVCASAADSLSDCGSTFAVLVSSIIIKATDAVIIDSIVGLLVSVLILIAGVKILNETKNSLLGEAPVDETVKAIEEIVSRHEIALGIHDLMVHNYGPGHTVASLHVEVDGSLNIFDLHDEIDNIERELRAELKILCTIHMDPIEIHDEKVAILRDFLLATIREIDETVTVHDFRTVIGTTHTNLIFDVVLPFDSKRTPDEIVRDIRAAVSKKRPNYYCVITVDRG